MDRRRIEHLGSELAACRRRGETSALPLHEIASLEQAEAVQAVAVAAYGGQRCGYKIGATSPGVQRMLGCEEPFFAPLFANDMVESGATYRLPPGLLGIECEFAFVMARAYPAAGEAPSPDTLADAIASCHLALEIVGRRVDASIPLDAVSATADFALDMAYVHGPRIPDWRARDLAAVPVTARVDGQVRASGTGAEVLGSPLNALLWLARALAVRGAGFEAGDIVSTGTCTGIVPVGSGQRFRGDFGDLGFVEVTTA